MSRACDLTSDAARDLKKLPKDVRKRISNAVEELRDDPLRGDVKPLKGREWKGVWRKRVGDYRLFFTVDRKRKTVTVAAIALRRTYW